MEGNYENEAYETAIGLLTVYLKQKGISSDRYFTTICGENEKSENLVKIVGMESGSIYTAELNWG